MVERTDDDGKDRHRDRQCDDRRDGEEQQEPNAGQLWTLAAGLENPRSEELKTQCRRAGPTQ